MTSTGGLTKIGGASNADEAIALALKTLTALETSHLEPEEEEGEVVH